MNILHLVARSHFRGAETSALDLSEELDGLGYRNRVVSVVRAVDGTEQPELPSLTRFASLGPRAVATAAWRLRRMLAEHDFDAVIGHGGTPTEVAALALVGRRPALVWQRIQPFPASAWRPRRRLVMSAVASRVDAAAALTTDLETELRRLGFKGPIWKIPNARRPDRFVGVDRAAAADDVRAELGIAPHVALVGFVGALFDVKRPDRAIDVVATLRDHGQQVCLLIAGDGPLMHELQEDVHRRGLGDAVRVLGHRRDVERILGAIDVLVVTSDVEGVPGALIEAAMAGCPAVTFAVGGVADVVVDGVTGVVVPRPDPTLMADCVAHLLRDAPLRRAMSEAARSRGMSFAAAPIAERYASQIADLVATKAAATA